MPFQANQELLHYRLTEKIGEGGMGAVWKAVDTSLDREVAIKTLPEAFSADPERLARFEREAKLLASLNHPNIATIHGLHAFEGRRFLAMELVEGDDLSRRIERGPLPVDDALKIAQQIAEGLEVAHESGVIHRDLKPANVKLTTEGQVKILDFGLAKALAPETSGEASSVSMSPTVTSAGTVVGTLLGTAAYMSPEQARGHAVDRRADIWSFGCVLFEMLTGQRPFLGETISDSLASILAREPDWSALPSKLPAAVTSLLVRCLDKDARTRLRDIGEARVLLADPPKDVREAPVARTSAPWGWIALVALLALLLGWRLLAPGRETAGGDALPSFSLTRLTELQGPERSPNLSPDGKQLLYNSKIGGNHDIYLLRVGGALAINLTADSTDDDVEAAFAPDGESIAFRSERDGGGLFVMGATGESVRRVTDFGFNPAWSPDGSRLAFGTESVDDPYGRMAISALWTVDLQSGKETRLLNTDAVQPRWSPDGKRIAFWSNIGGQRDISTVAATGGDAVAVTLDAHTDWSPTWSPDGRWLYFSSDRGGSMDLWRVAIDSSSGKTDGEPQRVTGGVRAVGHAGFSADGSSLVLMAYERLANLSFHDLDPADPCTVVSTYELRNQSPTWCYPSPNGKKLACTLRGAQEDIVTLAADGSGVRRLTDDPPKDRDPFWSPDGDDLYFYSTRTNQWEVWSIRADGSGLRQVTDLFETVGSALSPDAKRMMLTAHYYDEMWLIDPATLNTRDSAKQLEVGIDGYMPLWWSPHGDRIAGVVVDDSGRASRYVIYDLAQGKYEPLDDVAPRLPSEAGIGGWFPDSRRLLLISGTDLTVYDTTTGASCSIMPLESFYQFSLNADGTQVFVEQETVDSAIWLLRFE